MRVVEGIEKPCVAYPGSAIQQNYGEDLEHGYLLWNIESRDVYDVEFCQLPNPKPYVTIEWNNTPEDTFRQASKYPLGSRFRVRSKEHITHQDVSALTSMIKRELSATEVTYKIDLQINRGVICAGGTTLVKNDLRNADVLLRLIKDYHANATVSEDEWKQILDLVQAYVNVVHGGDEVARNTTWSLRRLEFENLFGYGSGNVINFDDLSGIVGVFGPNATGKSSIPGALMYALFNDTDRGAIKNMHVCNIRKPFCRAKVILTTRGADYLIERQTVKHEQRSGNVHGVTDLNIIKYEGEEVTDLNGEQRKDSDKTIRRLLGTSDDFTLTSLSSQGSIDQFVKQGSSKRRQSVARFLDLDFIDMMFDMSNNRIKEYRIQLRNFPDRDWDAEANKLRGKIDEIKAELDLNVEALDASRSRLHVARGKLSSHDDFTPVTAMQVTRQRERVATLSGEVDDLNGEKTKTQDQLNAVNEQLVTIEQVSRDHDVSVLKKKLAAFNALSSKVSELSYKAQREDDVYNQQMHSLKVLRQVPCGDQFPKCRFIKDAHANKGKIDAQLGKLNRISERLKKAQDSLAELEPGETVQGQIDKLEKLGQLRSRLLLEQSECNAKIAKDDTSLAIKISDLEEARCKLEELEEALKNEENAEVVALRSEIDELEATITRLERENLKLATRRGHVQSDIKKLFVERKSRNEILQNMRIHELITSAFSRKGIPNMITASQLPLINAEISKILSGIVNFTVEFDTNDDSDRLDVYINYGDSRRIIELASGMEKTIGSIAIRVALINISSLPKSDVFIIDEGFGALDDSNVEACNRLLQSLVKYFKTVIVITHVDAVKDIMDNVLEITKDEKDAKIVYS
jgi:DNA repair exonuclease SbcCD ATPase subunit